MGLTWTWWGALGTLDMAVAIVLAVVVYMAAPYRRVNRLLSLYLILEGVGVTTCAAGIDLFFTAPNEYYATQIINNAVTIASIVIYLLFLGVAVDTPLVRPFRSPWATALGLAAIIAGEWILFTNPDQFVAGLTTPRYSPYAVVVGPWGLVALRIYALACAFGLIVAVDAFRRARTPTTRRRATAYMAAFAVRDVWWMLVFFVLLPFIAFYTDPFWSVVWTQFTPFVFLLFMALLAYGILRTQLFDIDLRVKATVKYSTLAATFFVVFFLVSEGVEWWISSGVGTLAGLVVAAGLSIAIRPLERAASRVADRVMPRVRDSAEYRRGRKLQVFRAALEGAFADGRITARERTILERVRSELGIASADARRMEHEVGRLVPASG